MKALRTIAVSLLALTDNMPWVDQPYLLKKRLTALPDFIRLCSGTGLPYASKNIDTTAFKRMCRLDLTLLNWRSHHLFKGYQSFFYLPRNRNGANAQNIGHLSMG